jgi:2-hydroxychromene-2-carboxylate isomerase
MNNILLSKAIAKALQDGESVYDIAKATGLTKTEVLNMADNANSRDYSHLEQTTMQTRKSFNSQILARAFDFEAQKAGRGFEN